MEIFTNEFKELLSTQLEELTNVVKKDEVKIDGAVVMSDYEIAKFMDACMNNPDCGKKEKKKKNKKFKEGDVVYWGERKGVVMDKYKEQDEASLHVSFKENGEFRSWELSFTKDGRFINGTPIILSHFPYELKMKKIK
jgi:hypothetical protein